MKVWSLKTSVTLPTIVLEPGAQIVYLSIALEVQYSGNAHHIQVNIKK